MQHHKVVIIGAGMAGLGAARTLSEMGIKDFLLIEAQKKPGGRIHTIEYADQIIELGAQWIHGRGNPLYKLALKRNLLAETTSEEGLGVYLRENGDIIDNDLVKRVDFEIGSILTDCETFITSSDYPESVGAFMETRFQSYLDQSGDCVKIRQIKRDLFNWHVRFQVIDNSCRDLYQLSAKNWGKYVCVDDKAHFNLKYGYSELVNILVKDIPEENFLYNTPIISIDYRPWDSVQLICENKSIITCDHLIITASLGAVKHLDFTPSLPENITNSIRNMGYYGIGKIFLIFDHKWWGDVAGFQFVWGENSEFSEEYAWTKYITGFDPVFNAPNALLGWIGGNGVEVLEKLSDQEVGEACMKLIRRFVRNYHHIPDPIKVFR